MKFISKIIFSVLIFFYGCSSQLFFQQPSNAAIRIKGSDSMLLLVQRCAEEFMKTHDGISIYSEGGGSGTGVQALINGKIDICAASRPLIPKEIQMLASRYHSIGISILCAKDALSIIVHPSNNVSNLTTAEITKIFTGEISNWKEFGGVDKPITVYNREPNSGTYSFLEEHAPLGKSFWEKCIVVPGARALTTSVANDSFGIGYGTFVYSKNVKLISVNSITPTVEHVRDESYPISRYLYFYTIYTPEGNVRKFLDWIISKEGQQIIKKNGYISLYENE